MLAWVILTTFVTFNEPNFPLLDVRGLPAIDGTVETRSVPELADALKPDAILVWRHGSAFPADFWPAFMNFLDAGGSFLYLGGEPFTRFVVGEPGHRVVQARSVAGLKALRLNQCYRVNVGGLFKSTTDHAYFTKWIAAGVPPPGAPVGPGAWAAVLEPRLCQTRDFDDEDGSAGARDGVVTPLQVVHAERDSPRFPVAAAAIQIDWQRGRWAGGRWLFWLLSDPPADWDLTVFEGATPREPIDIEVAPTFGCFYPGERPSLLVRVSAGRRLIQRFPSALGGVPSEIALELIITTPNGDRIHHQEPSRKCVVPGSHRIDLNVGDKPGLYRVSARLEDRPLADTGFWIYDAELLRSGGPLHFDPYTLRRDGRPEPIVGTTVMSQAVHRKFLFEPNAAVWDDTFRELAELRINMVRTGVWTGYRKISLDPGVVDESFLRALEAYYLSARRHGIPVMFTFFAFVPPAFGGENPYFDPRAIEGQRAYVAAIAGRFAAAKEIIWDLINEPSFSSPKHLWQCRPNGDEYEKRAFLAWLEKKFTRVGSAGVPPAPDRTNASRTGGTGASTAGGTVVSRVTSNEAVATPAGSDGVAGGGLSEPGAPSTGLTPAVPGVSWQDEVRSRWRLAPDEPIGLPTLDDFEDRTVFGDNHPYRAADYIWFAQEAFADWCRQMTDAIRAAGSKAPITVGQDEGGLGQRPSPLFHHDAVDFTSMHTWWNNDALLWDAVAAKARGKALIVSETGVMQRELLSGEALRQADDSARLLARKLALAFAGGAGGVIQWCYDANPYMASDNEVAIGLRRVDGSYKPEHRVLREFAAFFARNRGWFERDDTDDVVVVVPAMELFSPRDRATAALRRIVERVAASHRSIRLTPDLRAADDLRSPREIILPPCRGIRQAAWEMLLASSCETLTCFGWFECDEVGRPAARLGVARRPLQCVEPPEQPEGRSLRFAAAAAESWFAATCAVQSIESRSPNGVIRRKKVNHQPLPIDWSESGADSFAEERPSGVTNYRVALRRADLHVLLHDGQSPRQVLLREEQPPVDLPPRSVTLALIERETGRLIDQLQQ